jgi:hypothetical protein
VTAVIADLLRALCASIAERTGPDGHPDVLTLLAAMSDTLDEAARLQAELDRAIARANRNARLAADCADRERERIADWFTAEGDRWRVTNNTAVECEYDRAAQMVRDSAGGDVR